MPAYHLTATLLPDGDRPMDLWIVNGRFSFTPQAGAEELAPAGGFALPGLVDCHAHLTLDLWGKGLEPGSAVLVAANRRDQLAAGVLLLRDIGAIGATTLGLSGEDGLPRLQPAGRFLAPPGGYFEFGQFVTPERLAVEAAAQVAAGALWVKIVADWQPIGPDGNPVGETVPNFPAETLAAAVAAVHAAGGRVAVHTTGYDGLALSVAAGVDSVEHGVAMTEPLLDEMARHGIAWTPTLTTVQQLADWAIAAGETGRAAWLNAAREQVLPMIPRARTRGITVLAGTDVLPHGAVAREVAALQAAGLSPADALASASASARAFLGEPGIEEGAPADLVLYTVDPRNDPETLARPALIMLGGQRVGAA